MVAWRFDFQIVPFFVIEQVFTFSPVQESVVFGWAELATRSGEAEMVVRGWRTVTVAFAVGAGPYGPPEHVRPYDVVAPGETERVPLLPPEGPSVKVQEEAQREEELHERVVELPE